MLLQWSVNELIKDKQTFTLIQIHLWNLFQFFNFQLYSDDEDDEDDEEERHYHHHHPSRYDEEDVSSPIYCIVNPKLVRHFELGKYFSVKPSPTSYFITVKLLKSRSCRFYGHVNRSTITNFSQPQKQSADAELVNVEGVRQLKGLFIFFWLYSNSKLPRGFQNHTETQMILTRAGNFVVCTHPAREFHFFEIRYYFVTKVLVQGWNFVSLFNSIIVLYHLLGWPRWSKGRWRRRRWSVR